MTTTALLPADVRADLARLDLIEEGLADQAAARRLLAGEDVGWGRLEEDDAEVITREQLLTHSKRARFLRIADPLICRGVNLSIAYVHGQGVTVAADQEEGAEQDVNAVVQAFLDDPSNVATFTGQQAREELEAKLKTDGNAFHVLVTSPVTGRVQVRSVPLREMVDVLTDPEDAATPWFYKRVYTVRVIEAGYQAGSTRTRKETRTVFYPALGYFPKARPKALGSVPVEWDKPVVHTAVNRPDGATWGVPDLLAALPWAAGYKEFLEDWAKLVKALSRLAFKTTARNRGQAGTIRDALRPGEVPGVGGTAVIGEGQQLEAIGKSGATIDSNSGRPLAAMVAAALGVPVTMLLGDPGVTGARATAETLDQPMQLGNKARQTLHTHLIKAVLDHVIDQAIIRPAGPLKGGLVRDGDRVTATLANDQPRSVTVDWPSIEKVSIEVLVKAITEADGTGKLPPEVVARLLLVALDVDDVDEVLAKMMDEQGLFVYPEDAAAARAQQDAVRRGDLPGTPADTPPAPPAAAPAA